MTGIGALEPEAVALASAAVSDPASAPTIGSRAATASGVAFTGSIATLCTVPRGMSGSPARSTRSPRSPVVRSIEKVSPGGRSGCHGVPAPGVATCHASPERLTVVGTSYDQATPPGRVHRTARPADAVSPSRALSPTVTSTGDVPRSLTTSGKASRTAVSANGTVLTSLATHAAAKAESAAFAAASCSAPCWRHHHTPPAPATSTRRAATSRAMRDFMSSVNYAPPTGTPAAASPPDFSSP